MVTGVKWLSVLLPSIGRVEATETGREEFGTLEHAAWLAMGVTLTDVRHARFRQPGWFYGGSTDTKCPVDGETLHVFRKSYQSAGRDYLYAACVCSGCLSAVAAADLGLKTAGLGLDQRLQHPPLEPRLLVDNAHDGLEELEFQSLLIECVRSLPAERLRWVMMDRLGMGRDALTVREAAERRGAAEGLILDLQQEALSILGGMARRSPDSAPHRLAAKLGVIGRPNHLEVAATAYRFASDLEPQMAQERSWMWLVMAGAEEPCCRHIAGMVSGQVQALLDWKQLQSAG